MGTALLVLDLLLAVQLPGFAGLCISALVGCCLALWIVLQGWFWSIIAFYDGTRKEALHNAWLLLGREWSVSLRTFLGSVDVLALNVFFPPIALFFSGRLLAVFYEVWIHRCLMAYEDTQEVEDDG
ncbi:MAG: hypothetical protein IMW91_09215 [Firmicutes bacterium]|nr:hypothetical protein [Bacillota bacterium]